MAGTLEQDPPAEYAYLATLCLREAERTLDREVAQALRTMAARYSHLAERSRPRDPSRT
jgi:hypothetical protein